MNVSIAKIAAAFCFALLTNFAAKASVVTITGQTAGPSPFISKINATVTNAATLDHVDFKIYPKSGSVTRPVFARYSSSYLQGRGYLNTNTGQVTIPVFGLYANYANTVALIFFFSDQTYQRFSVTVQTPAWTDSTGVYQNPNMVQPRLTTAALSYDFIQLKSFISANTPIVIDTDGQVRWVGTAGVGTQSVNLFNNGFYLCNGGSGLIRMEWDGSYTTVANYNTTADYSGDNVTYIGHHNIDFGKSGLLLDCNTSGWTECVNLEVDASGNVLHEWNMGTIITNAITAYHNSQVSQGHADSESASAFAVPGSTDWFHNNAVTYRPSDDSLIISSRENFVIAIDYSTGTIKWILGDPTKNWYVNYPALRQYALTLVQGSPLSPQGTTLPPQGQHGLSIYRDNLMLFDDGFGSAFQQPPGGTRGYSSPRKYVIDTTAMTATEIWNYPANQSLYSNICSSVYEDRSQNYLICYATLTELIGLDPTGAKVFDYKYSGSGCPTIWNATPIHMENIRFN